VKKQNGHNNNSFQRSPDKDLEIRRERRQQARLERLDTTNPSCVVCGERDSRTLEKHHLEGRQFGETLVHACRNCHRKLSDSQNDHAHKITEIPDPLEAIGHFLLGLADLFELLVRKLREFAAQLIERADPNRDNVQPSTP
jgi:hypothetical protein